MIDIKTKQGQMDARDISQAVMLLDLFAKTFCRYRNDYERFDDLKFRCDECPFQMDDRKCKVKVFKNKYAPDYKDFGSTADMAKAIRKGTPLLKRHGKLTNHEWIDFLTEQFDISRTSAKEMLHAMMSVNFKKQFSQGKKGFSQGGKG